MATTEPTFRDRRDGHSTRYNYFPEEPHYIEHTVRVYLRLSDDGTRWIVDAPTVDGSPLDSDYENQNATNVECVCERPDECEARRAAADRIALPTGAELAQLLWDALPE